jgi:hypothetical protein
MKKFIFMALALCAPVAASSQEAPAICYSIADYGQSVMEARQLGMTQSQVASVGTPSADPAVRSIISSIQGLVFSLPIRTTPEATGNLLFSTCLESLPTSP